MIKIKPGNLLLLGSSNPKYFFFIFLLFVFLFLFSFYWSEPLFISSLFLPPAISLLNFFLTFSCNIFKSSIVHVLMFLGDLFPSSIELLHLSYNFEAEETLWKFTFLTFILSSVDNTSISF